MNYLADEECLLIAQNYTGIHLVSRGKTSGGVSSYVLELEADDGREYYFKQGNSNYLLQEKLGKIFQNQGLPSPSILLATDKYMIVKGVIGEAMKDVVDRETKLQIAERFGEYLANLHKNTTTGWGELVDIDRGKFKSYLDFYANLIPYVPTDFQERVKEVLAETSCSCLNHADTGSSHIFTDREEGFWGLIDFDDVLSAPYIYDLAEFHGGIGDDTELWDRTMFGYSKVGKTIDINSLEFLVNEYLIYLDSWVWYKKQNRQDLNTNMQRDLEKVNILAERIRETI